jgi:hypothetical protein
MSRLPVLAERKIPPLKSWRVGLVIAALMGPAGAVSLAPKAEAAPAPGVITGSADDSTTGAAAPGICVYAYAVNGNEGLAAKVSTGAQYEATTVGDGTYEIEAPTGYYVVRFDPSCGGTVASP